MTRSAVVVFALFMVSTALLPAGHADQPDPQDAVGNIRASQAPYVQPADHRGRLIASDFSVTGKVSCPSESIEVIEEREGGDPVTRKSPGRYHADDVTICGDKSAMKPILDWFRALKSGASANYRRNPVLEILGANAQGKESVTCKFTLARAWPHQINWAPDGTVCVQLAVEFTDRVDP